jgi:hypothetical protein
MRSATDFLPSIMMVVHELGDRPIAELRVRVDFAFLGAVTT